MTDSAASRREFLTGRALQTAVERVGEQVVDAIVAEPPSRGPMLVLRTAAMATDFDVLLNPDGPDQQVAVASAALDEVHRLEQLLTVYRPDSDLSRLNATAADRPVAIDAELYRLLRRAAEIHRRTEGAFDPASQALIALWRDCRRDERVPIQTDINSALQRTGLSHVRFDDAAQAIVFDTPGVGFNLGAIGKGYAVDRAGAVLEEAGVENWLVHGGRSSARARGTHAGHDGWPVGLHDPLRPDRPYLTLLLKDAALSTSGTAVQWFRHDGRRYGHILDPRSGWPVESMLSVSVIAPDAALADALSTAFFVLGVEKALAACDTFSEVGVILFPLPSDGRTLSPIIRGIPPERLLVADPITTDPSPA